jgi:hypothetical protein
MFPRACRVGASGRLYGGEQISVRLLVFFSWLSGIAVIQCPASLLIRANDTYFFIQQISFWRYLSVLSTVHASYAVILCIQCCGSALYRCKALPVVIFIRALDSRIYCFAPHQLVGGGLHLLLSTVEPLFPQLFTCLCCRRSLYFLLRVGSIAGRNF